MEAENFIQNSFRVWNILPSAFLELCNRRVVQLFQNPSADSISDYTKLSVWREAFAPFVKQRSKTDIDENGIAHNLSDLADIATARSNLQVRSIAESDSEYLVRSADFADLHDKAACITQKGLAARRLEEKAVL